LAAALANAETELSRRERLFEQGHIAQANVDDQVMLVDAALAKIEATDGLLDAARLNLSYTQMTAPFSGVISQKFADNFQNVVAKQPVLRLLDTSRIEMEVAVPESLIGLADYVEEVSVSFTSLPGMNVPATIARIGSEASLMTRTYPVTLVMEQPDGAPIQAGMAGFASGRVRLPSDWGEAGVVIPTSAVFTPTASEASTSHVWVIDEPSMSVKSHPIEILRAVAQGFLVDGLSKGDRIVTAGVNMLVEGQQVRLLDN